MGDFEVEIDDQLYAVTCINLDNPKYSDGEANFNIIAYNPGFEGKRNLTSSVEILVLHPRRQRQTHLNLQTKIMQPLSSMRIWLRACCCFEATAEDVDQVY